MTGWTDPDNRRPFPWGAEDKHILNYYKAMIALHKRYKAILTGSLSYLYLDYGLICYGRWDSEEKLAVIINNGETHRSVEVPVWRLEMLNGEKMYEVISSHRGGYETSNKDHTVTNGTIKIDLTSKACVVLANVK
jgi:alpha-glucosidase